MANKELSPELRIMLAFALSFLILLLSRPLLVRPPQPPAAGPGPAAEPSQPARDKLSPGKEEAQLQADLPAAPVAGQAEELIIVESDRYRVVLSTRGAVVKSWTLKEYKDERGGPLEVVHSEAAQRYGEPLSVWVADESARAEVNQALFVPSASGELRAPLALSFEYRGERVAARKQIVFAPDSYVVEIDSTLSADGRPVPHELAWRGGFGDRHDAVVRGTRWDVFYRQPDRMVRLAAGEVEGAASHVSGPFLFAGIEDHFFAAAFLPAQTGLRVTAFPDEVKVLDQEDPVASIGVAVG
ncbi:MAG TPA: membrane protein insertase YidC, partial [Terriglobia bacterium]|nr:membrane protein insertase YidC [Terriglobia bacterium]